MRPIVSQPFRYSTACAHLVLLLQHYRPTSACAASLATSFLLLDGTTARPASRFSSIQFSFHTHCIHLRHTTFSSTSHIQLCDHRRVLVFFLSLIVVNDLCSFFAYSVVRCLVTFWSFAFRQSSSPIFYLNPSHPLDNTCILHS